MKTLKKAILISAIRPLWEIFEPVAEKSIGNGFFILTLEEWNRLNDLKGRDSWIEYGIQLNICEESDFSDICGEDIDFAVEINPSLQNSLFGDHKEEEIFRKKVENEMRNFDFNQFDFNQENIAVKPIIKKPQIQKEQETGLTSQELLLLKKANSYVNWLKTKPRHKLYNQKLISIAEASPNGKVYSNLVRFGIYPNHADVKERDIENATKFGFRF